MSITDTADQQVDRSLNCLFAEGAGNASDLNDRAEAFNRLAEQYLNLIPGGCYRSEDLQFDNHALRLMLGRFQRDAFGVSRLWNQLDQECAEGKIDAPLCQSIKERVLALGLRVCSEKPRKTRIAAVFSLWMSTFRPVSIKFRNDPIVDKQTDRFCAALNFWITQTYLSKFGQVILGNQTTQPELMRRILHDFTFRDLNLSSLEMLYCNVFRAREG